MATGDGFAYRSGRHQGGGRAEGGEGAAAGPAAGALPSMDPLFRAGYRLAYRLLQVWWLVRRPEASGAAVAAWHGGRLLVVRTSYHAMLDLPGGGISGRETPRAAAARELREETGLQVRPDELVEAGSYRFVDLHRRITDRVFVWRPAAPLEPVADRREVIWAGWMVPEELAQASLSPLLRLYLEALPPDGGRTP
jgi:8-oxo-dGTP pyrophosphatase MutT (NUDIX family)